VERFGGFQVNMDGYTLFWVVLARFVALQAVLEAFEPT
jgi:hypothetical protein